jgi:hypothetical protein
MLWPLTGSAGIPEQRWLPPLELGTELELLGPEHNVDLTEDQVDAPWTQARLTSNFLGSYVPPSAAHGSPTGTRM